MGNSCSRLRSSRRRRSSAEFRPPVRVPSDSGIKMKHVDDLGRVSPAPPRKDQTADTGDKMPPKSTTPNPLSKNGYGAEDKPIKFADIEDSVSSGDLAVLYRGNNKTPHFAVFIRHDHSDSNFPLLLLKGKTKPLPLERFDRTCPRDAHTTSATTRIFYGDYRKVAVHKLLTDKGYTKYIELLDLIEQLSGFPFTEQEVKAIREAPTPEERSAILCTFTMAYFYKRLGELQVKPNMVTPQSFVESLNLSEPTYIKLPQVKEGPLKSGDPPFLAKLVNGIMPPPDVTTVPLSSIASELETGDIVLFSGATSSGAIIKFFDHSEFSHVGLVLRSKHVAQLLVWEASTNKAGLVDISSGKVRKGVELLPLTRKIFSGWYDRVAIRRLTGIDEGKRAEMVKDLLAFRKEVQGRPYEQDRVELALSMIDVHEKYMSFLRNTEEDLSSLFCSELVAAAYQRMGLLDYSRSSNAYTPDDFSSASDLKLNFGKLGPEMYVELKFDFQFARQTSVY